MEVTKVNSIKTTSPALKNVPVSMPRQGIAFKANPVGNAGNKFSKQFWLLLRRFGNGMKEITELENAAIAAIGTGIIAPAIILVSPGKGDKDDKDKKFLQALRQPLSAALQLGFQVPATMFINRGIDELAYDKKIKFFQDDVIGDLIPSEKHIARQIKEEEIEAYSRIFDDTVKGSALRKELEEKIKENYKEVGLDISDKELERQISKKKNGFLRNKIAQRKVEEIKNNKIQDILKHPEKYPKLANIKPIDLVTEGYQELAEHKLNAEFRQLEKDANLSIFDKVMRLMGLETKKIKKLKEAQKAFKEKNGLKILEEKPEIFKDKVQKLKTYLEAHQAKANKSFEGKKFWISLLVNIVMVTISCFTLNWIHPKVNKWLENRKAEKNANNNPKVEVK